LSTHRPATNRRPQRQTLQSRPSFRENSTIRGCAELRRICRSFFARCFGRGHKCPTVIWTSVKKLISAKRLGATGGLRKTNSKQFIELQDYGQSRICGLCSSSANSVIKVAACSVFLNINAALKSVENRVGMPDI
jgi:hypothetical protein